ncbi:MAG: DUF3987 domain-containing protein [Acidobacteriota bacterium]
MKLLEEVEGVNFGPQAITWQALTQSLAESRRDISYGEEFLPMSCITCAISELGTFLKPEDQDLVDALVSLWDGQLEEWGKKTKTMGSDLIVNPWINVIGCTTPAWLRKNFPEELILGGLTSRVVFVYGDEKHHLVPYPADIVDAGEFTDKGKKLIEDLNEIAYLVGEYELTPEAKAWGIAWYEHHWSNRPTHLASERFGGYIARKQTHIHKVAMVLAAANRDELFITDADMESANGLVTALEEDMQLVFHSMGVGSMARSVAEMLSYVRAYGVIDHKELWRRCMPIMGTKEFAEAIKAASQAGYIRMVQKEGTILYYPVKIEEEEK